MQSRQITETFLRLPDVIAATGLKRSSIYAAIQNQKFPAPVKIGLRASGWPSSLIESWIAQKIAEARK